MSDLAIRVLGLGKRYRIGARQARYRTLRESLMEALLSPFRRAGSLLHGSIYGAAGLDETIWALRNVSFEVRHGEVVGIIGRNGAGKSTLLKVLSQITEPTEGTVDLFGRVGSLLEVGTGFHPELTGRENIYLNGAILGMSRAEINRKFDEIVDFSGVERFIDTPVKHYSSGMQLRLGFAVAAHLEPDILVVDEVLAVGDAEFQKKCLGKMGAVASQGRTVLFVSHNMAAINSLCQKGILLENGRVAFHGAIHQCIRTYLRSDVDLSAARCRLPIDDARPAQLLSVAVTDAAGHPATELPYEQPFQIQVEALFREALPGIYFAVHIHDRELETLLFSRDFESDETRLRRPRRPGKHTLRVKIPGAVLPPGDYSISVHLARNPGGIQHGADYICRFEMVDHTSVRARLGFPWHGRVATPLVWETVEFEPLEPPSA